MAEGKKGFILYADIIHTVKKLPIEKRGELFTIILEYVNDQNPEVQDLLVDLVWEPIKNQLKRDLKKYESRAKRSRENGKLGGRPITQPNPKEPSGLNGNPEEPKKPDTVNVIDTVIDNDTVTDTVNVNDTVTVNETVKEKKEGVFFPFNTEKFKEQWQFWKDFKNEEFKFKYKSIQSEQAALKKLAEMSNNNESIAIEIIHQSFANGWKGFFELKQNGKSGTTEADAKQFGEDWVRSRLDKLQGN